MFFLSFHKIHRTVLSERFLTVSPGCPEFGPDVHHFANGCRFLSGKPGKVLDRLEILILENLNMESGGSHIEASRL